MSILEYIGMVLGIVLMLIADIVLIGVIAYFLRYIVEALRYFSE